MAYTVPTGEILPEELFKMNEQIKFAIYYILVYYETQQVREGVT